VAIAVPAQPIKQAGASYTLDAAFHANDETSDITLIFTPTTLILALDDAKTNNDDLRTNR
jgi:hypothetical protein